jgi:signal transduction histidine kinase
VEDLLEDQRIALPSRLREWLQATPQRAGLAAPMLVQERVTGAVAVSAVGPRRFHGVQTRLVEAFANLGALALENARLHEQALDASRARDEFLAAISHELRTPLTVIAGWVSVLRASASHADVVRRAVEALERSTRAQRAIIDELLDVSRISTGRLRLRVSRVDLAAVVRDALDVARPAMDAKGLRCDTRIEVDAAPVLGDPARLGQVAWHLLSNATRLTPRGGRIDVRLEREGGQARLVVCDTGPGIRPEILPFAFERFRQAMSTPGPAHGGLGLGLSVVRHIVELHGGTVRAESAGEAEGATFIVQLPLARPGDPDR